MKIVANGQEQQIAEGHTVATFLARCGWKPTQVVVEYNGNILPNKELEKHVLSEDDRLEIIVPVAGG